MDLSIVVESPLLFRGSRIIRFTFNASPTLPPRRRRALPIKMRERSGVVDDDDDDENDENKDNERGARPSREDAR